MKHKLIIIVFSIILALLFAVNMLATVAGGLLTYKFTMGTQEEKEKATTNAVIQSINKADILKYPFVEINSMFQLSIGKSTVEDADPLYTVVRLKNDYLTFVYPEYNTDFYEQDLIDFNNELSGKDIPMIYVQVPIKNDKYDSSLMPYGLEDYSNKNADKLLNGLNNNGVHTIDLREVLHDDKNLSLKYFRTDHHWLPETAFDAYSHICDVMNKKYGFDIPEEYYSLDSFTVDIKKDYVLGHIGNRVGVAYSSGTEDISIIKPNFPTRYTFDKIIDELGNYNPQFKTGEYENTILDMNKLNQPIVYSRIGYHTYIGGDYGELNITNDEAPVDKKILLVRDSFGAPFAAFLSTAVKELDVVDLRYFGEDRTLSDYVEETSPDMVIFFMSPHMYEDACTQALDFYDY